MSGGRGRMASGTIMVEGQLELTSPCHVGGLTAVAGVDLTVARDAAGRHIIPGTSLAGALRERLGQPAQAGDVEKLLWGFAEADGSGRASRLYLDDLPVSAGGTTVRDGVVIEPRTGAAADELKYDFEVLPAGAHLALRLEVELAPDERDAEQQHRLLATLLTELLEGRVSLGRGRSRGFGAIRLLPSARVRRFRSRGSDDVLAELEIRLACRGDGEPVAEFVRDHVPFAPAGEDARVVLSLSAKSLPILVAARQRGNALDHMPLVSPVAAADRQPAVALLLPGSSIKGALRAHAERIMRTVLGLRAPDGSEERLLPGAVEPGLEAVAVLFGAPLTDEGEGLARGGRGVLSCQDVVGPVLSAELWDVVQRADSSREVQQALSASPGFVAHTMNAIDRWTGSVAGSRLYGRLEPPRGAFPKIVLDLDLDRLARISARGEAERRVAFGALALLRLVLADARAGLLAFGGGVTRGLGASDIDEIEVLGGSCSDAELQEAIAGLAPDVAPGHRLVNEWQALLDAHGGGAG